MSSENPSVVSCGVTCSSRDDGLHGKEGVWIQELHWIKIPY